MKFLIPNRFDAAILMIACILLIPLAMPGLHIFVYQNQFNGESEISILQTLIGSIVVAVGLVWGWGRSRVAATLPWLVAAAVALPLWWWSFRPLSNFDYLQNQRFLGVDWLDYSLGQSGALIKFYLILLVLGIVSWLIPRVLRLIASWVQRRRGISTTSKTYSRKHVLIAIALVLFALRTLQNIFAPPSWGSPEAFTELVSVGGPISAFLGVVFLILLPTGLLCNLRMVWQKCLVFFFFVGLSGWFAFETKLSLNSSTHWIGHYVLFLAIVFVLGLTTDKSHAEHRAARRSPSLWSALPILIVTISAPILTLYDIPTLLINGTAALNWDEARTVRQIYDQSDGDIKIVNYPTYSVVLLELDNSSDPDLLQCLNKYPRSFVFVVIKGITPQTNTSSLAARTFGAITLNDGELTSKQLQDLVSSCNYVHLSNLRVKEATGHVVLKSSASLTITVKNEVEVTDLLSTFDWSKPISQVSIHPDSDFTRQLTSEEMDAIVAASQTNLVYFDFRLLNQVSADWQPKKSLMNVFVNYSAAASTEDQLKSILRYDFSFLYHIYSGNLRKWNQCWDLLFAKAQRIIISGLQESDYPAAVEEFGFYNAVEKYHWGYQWTDDQKIKSLYIPGGEVLVLPADELQLEELSYEPGWLLYRNPPQNFYFRNFGFADANFYPDRATIDVSHLSAHLGLKRLYLPACTPVINLDFVNSLPNLELLAVRIDDTKPAPPMLFVKCPKLKTLIYYGTPGKSVLADLRKVKSLEQLNVFPDDDGTLIKSADIEKLLNAIPGVKISITRHTEPFEIPPAFQVHAAKTKATIREKYLSK